jgi:hypothetical protein
VHGSRRRIIRRAYLSDFLFAAGTRTMIHLLLNDYSSNPVRFFLETFGWLCSVSASVVLASTVQNPPMEMIFCLWLSGSACYLWAAYSRRSFGMLGNYAFLLLVDSVGLARLLF